jgi:hypothetical protein
MIKIGLAQANFVETALVYVYFIYTVSVVIRGKGT